MRAQADAELKEKINANLSEHLSLMSSQFPSKPAFLHPDRITYRELEQEVNRYAHGLKQIGIGRNTRTILLVTPRLEFFILTFALFHIGAVPVMIDPGMGAKAMAKSLAGVEAEAFVGSHKAHLLRFLYPGAFRTVKICLTLGRRWFWSRYGLSDLQSDREDSCPPCFLNPEDSAAILFTSGSTGPSKGVIYRTSMMNSQIAILRSHFKFRPEEIDLCTFPLIGLFSLCLGLTIVLADMDMTHPASLDPKKIIANIQDNGCTQMFCSPMVLDRLARYGNESNTRLSSLKRVITAGAPVSNQLLHSFKRLLVPEAEIYVPYGATEALPVTKISANELIQLSREDYEWDKCICLGYPLKETDVRIIAITDEPILLWDDAQQLPPNQVGEIVVKGQIVSDGYLNMPEADAIAKIKDSRNDGVWHRTGDLAQMDSSGRLWFFGRKSQRVITSDGTLFTIPCEFIFNQHPRVFRSALVGVPIGVTGQIKPVLCVQMEPDDPGGNQQKLVQELLAMGAANPQTRCIREILFPGQFPVDPRHNAKIFREKLTLWAARRIK
ncbi:MAG: AMP-binding protein [Candidatus Sabulitectum sp.]|nr:AMP-binding protein [Candidatus Sabulitectum sp.]